MIEAFNEMLAAIQERDTALRKARDEVEFVMEKDLVANGDSRLLRVAMENLLGNAWKYTARHTRARIEFGRSDREGRTAYFVRDDGAGFDPRYTARLFGAFQRLHSASDFPGTGVGLATVQRIVHRHGGEIWAVINGYGQLLEKRFVAGSPTIEHLEPILDAANRASKLTTQLLAFSRRQIFQLKHVNLNEVVTETKKMLVRMIGEQIELRTVLYPRIGLVKADSAQMEQVIMNLALNARDAMPTGGELTIETANIDFAEDFASERGGLKRGSHVMMAVGDTGAGMDKELQTRIFEPFFTTKEVGKGTGLGLATVYGIVKQSGGDIRVDSEPGRGSTFKVYLPSLKEEASLSEPAAPAAAPSTLGTETLLIVEDETMVRKLVVRVLAENGYTVLQTGQPNEALQLAKDHQGNIALLLTDVVMPQMTGPQLAEQILRIRPEIGVLYMSGYTQNAIAAQHAISNAEVAVLEKPFTPEALMSKVREVLNVAILTPLKQL